MNWLLDWIGYSAVDLDVLFLQVFTPDKPFINVFEVSRVRLNFGSATGTVDLECIELKFRIYDGTDIGHTTYASSTTIAFLKQTLIAEWPQGKTIAPKSVNDIKLIHAGKILENSKTLADSKVTFGDLPSSVITMHVVVQPHVAKKKTDKNKEEKQKQNSCSCTIL
ncbi:hypothetical protein QYF36_011724 [Acer negundo]|nr:hypothetical protein QYF36_011724 [Acer negundo]